MNGRKGKYTVIHHIYKIEYYTKMRKTNRTNLLLLVKNGGYSRGSKDWERNEEAFSSH